MAYNPALSSSCAFTGSSPVKPQALYAASGISTRDSVDLDVVNLPGSSGTRIENDSEEAGTGSISGLVTRPASSTRYEVYSQLSQARGSLLGTPLGSILGRLQGNQQATSYTLDQKFSKLVKMEKKVMKLQQEVIRDINSWCNVLHDDECKRLLYHLIKLLEAEYDVGEQNVKKQSQIMAQLQNVNKREKRTNELKYKRNKVLAKLREIENKVGDSPTTLLTRENLEELECSVEIVEDQLIRSINNGLKNSFVDYLTMLRSTGAKYRDVGGYFLDNYSFSTRNENSMPSLQRLILQNKYSNGVPSNAQSPVSRELTTSLSYQENYIALSPNHVGKYLDNVYEEAESNHTAPARQEHDGVVKKRGQQQSSSKARSGPPPTPDDSTPLTVPLTSGISSANEHAFSSILNSYSTPGGLGTSHTTPGVLRPPPSQHNHEWIT
ncbi:unnamed protein product [Cyberlindnera jadinii]|uniref:Uncharacterized protein n=1 Tax=Cyberlindnera jadinii (strain ATCC 18201 / CBS 1600 / BCRC 20928 / JCM 3617 / NBRC 0987 / NRRL Y-1542) TaxID=983966 RepID=A0A0H5C910_CYBJN|nr:unnamed protein product [Cyberlindnera jadinii]